MNKDAPKYGQLAGNNAPTARVMAMAAVCVATIDQTGLFEQKIPANPVSIPFIATTMDRVQRQGFRTRRRLSPERKVEIANEYLNACADLAADSAEVAEKLLWDQTIVDGLV